MRPLLNALAASLSAAVPYALLILAGCWVTSTHASDRIVAERVAGWDFGAKEDLRRDGWPDGWSRTTGQNFPKFIPIAIHQKANTTEELAEIDQFRRLVTQYWLANQQGKWPWQVIPESTPSGIDTWLERTVLNPYLRIQMNGGSAEVLSPLVPVDDHSVYFANGLIQSNSTDFAASLKLRFLNANRQTLFEIATKPLNETNQWQSVETESRYEFRDDIRYVQVVLCVQPKSAKAFRGEFGFDAIRVHRTPRLRLSVDKSTQLYRQGDSVTVRCTATGMNSEQPSLILKLVEHTGKEIRTAKMPFFREDLQSKKLVSKSAKQPVAIASTYWDGYCEWTLDHLDAGYYEITTQLARGKSGTFDLREQFAILPSDGLGRPDNRFGWTMTEAENALTTPASNGRFIEVLRESRVGKVKLPIWFDNQDPQSVRDIVERVDRVQTAGIQCVGVIASPPQSVRNKHSRLNSNETGSALEDSLLVQLLLEPVMRQMCVRMVDFQIGWDHETDFVANPRFSSSLESIVRLARRYGQEAQIIASHNPQLQSPKAVGIDRWQFHSDEELTEHEITSAIEASRSNRQAVREPWFSITPLHSNKYSLNVRVQDMVARMLAIAKETSAQSCMAWVSDPTNELVGVLGKTGSPREMFLPFRSMAGALAGLRNVGSLPVKSLGVNHLIVSADQARLVAWSPQPIQAQLYLGKRIQARDVWGRNVAVETLQTDRGPEQRLTLDKWPIIIDGIDQDVARWRMGISLEERSIDPLVGQTQELKIRFANPLAVPAFGNLRVIAPAILTDSPVVALEIDPNSNETISIPVFVLPNATTNTNSIQLEFTMSGADPVRFTIDEELKIGSDDIEFNTQWQIDDENQLWINLEAINSLDEPTSFDCMLLIPGRARERTQISNLRDRISRSFVLKDASELIGETLWLRCEQLGTRRVLNYQIKIEK